MQVFVQLFLDSISPGELCILALDLFLRFGLALLAEETAARNFNVIVVRHLENRCRTGFLKKKRSRVSEFTL